MGVAVVETQVTQWRELPSMVAARDGESTVKVLLPAYLQEAIDEAAMRLGADAADDYLAGWARTSWSAAAGSLQEAADALADELTARWTPDAVARYLDTLG